MRKIPILQVHPGYLAPRLPTEAPEEGEAWPAIMEDVEQHIMPGVTHWQSPNFFAYFPGNSSFPGAQVFTEQPRELGYHRPHGHT